VAKRSRSEYQYSADLVWAAACAAYRINGGYFKYAQVEDGQVTVPSNRDLVRMMLETPGPISDADRDQARRCRQDLSNASTLAALKNRLTEWGELSARMASLETVTTDYEISVITAMPKSWEQNNLRENTDSRLAHCDADPVGRLNERVELSGEIVRSNYSNRFNTFYTTVITEDNRQVFFAYREQLMVGRQIRFCGRVKRHADRATQLSRVKLVEQEVV
jgi:hypothetical protein